MKIEHYPHKAGYRFLDAMSYFVIGNYEGWFKITHVYNLERRCFQPFEYLLPMHWKRNEKIDGLLR
ncbi:MAG: hypothetical protein IH600_04295 [Bacteroidetes bacterium]|nr:hypothetical protein [Bacteroidota bacterium]